MAEDATTSFGYQEIPASEKEGRVGEVFSSVASRYDLMNDLMSAGVHRVWKHDTMTRLAPQPAEALLDVAGGTGELARNFLERAARAARRRGLPCTAEATVCDINHDMLAAGRRAEGGAGSALRGLHHVCASGEALPFRDQSFDAVTVSFGIRNFTDRLAGLREFRRVLKPVGRLAVLEFSQMTVPALQKLYDAYSFAAIPAIGAAVAGDRESYQYLVESIRRFPDQAAFKAEIESAGFSRVSVANFSGGIAALHVGWAA